MTTESDAKERFEQANASFELGHYEKAFELLESLVTDEFAPAMTLMGSAYSLGLGGCLDGPQAVRLYERAAALGDGLAAHNLGTLLWSGMPGVEADKDRALEWFRQARDLGCALMMVDTDDHA